MVTSDFLVIGSGTAGLNFALRASESASVCLVTKKDLIESNTNFAQGGIAAVFAKSDSFKLHVKDTLKAGDGLCDKEAVKIMVKDAPEEIENLLSMGAEFDTKGKGLALGKEGGHSKKRIVHKGDVTGAEVEKSLIASVRERKNIRIFEKHIAFELILKGGKCIGARVFDKDRKKVVDFFSKAVILATGGLCEVYENTTNPSIATGDGVAMGFKAGCEIKDIEFVQFHPTAFKRKGEPFFVISEAVRGEGGKLRNEKGKRFVNELSFRDKVARAIFSENKKGRVYIDIRKKGLDFLRRRFPTIYKTCREHGIDISKDCIPVEPVAHYSCGGIKTDVDGRTKIPGLFAFGEVACTGVHGANRLASNSLLESLVFSSRAVSAAKAYIKGKETGYTNLPHIKISKNRPSEIRTALRGLMWKRAGIVRNGKYLKEAWVKINKLQLNFKKCLPDEINEDIIETDNMLLVSKLIVAAAINRKESRGTHFREDYPKKDKKWKRHLVLNKDLNI